MGALKRAALAGVAAAVVAGAYLVPSSAADTADSYDAPLVQAVEELAVRAEAPRDGYSRAKFPHWKDADADGCDTRRELLIEEATEPVTVGDRCKLSGGSWRSYYDDVRFDDPRGMDADHMVPLAESWDSGAGQWPQERRQRYANDLGEPRALVAVSASSNRSKADRDVAEWLPPEEAALCRYVTDWVTVKARWGLAVDKPEKDVLERLAGAPCEEYRVTTVMAG